MIKRFYELQERILSYYSDANIELLKKAYTVAAKAHLNQKRESEEPYIIHPLAVAEILTNMRLDEISIAAGLLHDVIEDSQYTYEDLEQLFGKEIAEIVHSVTNISKISNMNVEDAQAETLKKMIIAMTNDVRVILIKLADRLHNVRTLEHLKESKIKKIAKETLEIYAPIAYRLGMGKVRDELEDISFKYLYPDEYTKIKQIVQEKHDLAKHQIEKLRNEIKKILRGYKIPEEIQFRIKREISIYRKLQRQNITIDKVYDLYAMRIITNSVANCYAIMGCIHQKWTHIPSRWRDFITHPKPNFYQSIHTTIITENKTKVEIQIRTKEMHSNAEEGIAAHWSYKEGLSFIEKDDRLLWFRDMIDYHKTNPDPKEFLSLIKKDLTPNEIYVFTPKGKVINLEAGACPIDFAYAIHTEIGNHCKNAIVNERLVPLKTSLNSGDMVEIITSENNHPSVDWLKFVVTTKARKKITSYLQKRDNAINIEKGKKIWQRILREYKKKYNFQFVEDDILERLKRIRYTEMDTFLRDVGSGKKAIDQNTLKALFPEVNVIEIKPVKKVSRKPSQTHKLIIVDDQKDIDYLLAKCCSPIKGDKIAGYMTRNRGLLVHQKDCPNIRNAIPSRIKKVAWSETDGHQYLVKLELIVHDRPGTLNTISGITAKYDSNIKNIQIEQLTQATGKIKLIFEVVDKRQLDNIYMSLKKSKDVYSIIRKRIAEK